MCLIKDDFVCGGYQRVIEPGTSPITAYFEGPTVTIPRKEYEDMKKKIEELTEHVKGLLRVHETMTAKIDEQARELAKQAKLYVELEKKYKEDMKRMEMKVEELSKEVEYWKKKYEEKSDTR